MQITDTDTAKRSTRAMLGHAPEYFEFTGAEPSDAFEELAQWLRDEATPNGDQPFIISITTGLTNLERPSDARWACWVVVDRTP